MAMALKQMKLIMTEKANFIWEVEKYPSVSQHKIVKCSVLPPSPLSNIILQKASILEEEGWYGYIQRNRKIYFTK
jgi:hypothetical protein